MKATHSPCMDLAVAVDWYVLEEKLFWKTSCSATEKAPWPCLQLYIPDPPVRSRKTLSGRGLSLVLAHDHHSTMLNCKGSQKETARDNDYLGQVLPR